MHLPDSKRDTIFNSPKLDVFVYPELQLLVIQAYGFVPSAVYRKGLTIATETAIAQKLPNWLVNNRAGGIISPADQIWANEVHAPRLAAGSSIKKMAFIEPADVHSRLILEDLMDKARSVYPFEMQFFEKVQDALVWFKDESSLQF